jgi:2,3-bisphosphoglycerate-independent phosphoglycerate mutase
VSGEFLAKNGSKTFVCSETQKFGVRLVLFFAFLCSLYGTLSILPHGFVLFSEKSIILCMSIYLLFLQHVTFFWNGNRSGYLDEKLETYLEIPSDTVPFNEKPDMKAREITAAAKEALRSGKFDQVRINFAKYVYHVNRKLSITSNNFMYCMLLGTMDDVSK